jgi:adenylate cyclase class 2
MYEVEAKFRARDPREMVARLSAHGVAGLRVEQIDDHYFGFPHLPESATATRVRTSVAADWSGAELTVKAFQERFGLASCRREISVKIVDADEMLAALRALGGEEVAHIRKSRRSCVVDGVTVCVDDIESLGYFVEIGGPVRIDQVQTMSKRVGAIALKLGLDPEDVITETYEQLWRTLT